MREERIKLGERERVRLKALPEVEQGHTSGRRFRRVCPRDSGRNQSCASPQRRVCGVARDANDLKLSDLRVAADYGLHYPDGGTFAPGYNGANYAITRYSVRLIAEFHKYSTGVLSGLKVRAAQLYLTYLGYHTGLIDGIAGADGLSVLAISVTKQSLEHKHHRRECGYATTGRATGSGGVAPAGLQRAITAAARIIHYMVITGQAYGESI
jgi:hypothetical protein